MTAEGERSKVLLEKDPERHVARITIDNPERRNAYDPPMRRQMAAFLDELATDDDIKVVILRGAGGNFSTGASVSIARASASTTSTSAFRRSRSRRSRPTRLAAPSSWP